MDKVLKLLGSNGNSHRAELDYYSTDPIALIELLKVHKFNNVWENAAGSGALTDVLIQNDIHGFSSDIVSRRDDIKELDFLSVKNMKWKGDILTNPPYGMAEQFIRHSLNIVQEGYKVAMLLRIQFLESKGRINLFKEHNIKYVYVSSSRIKCHANGIIDNKSSSAMCFAWFIWEKGFKGESIIRWFN